MPKAKTQFVCQECGTVTRKWAGQCTQCGAWNSIVEEVAPQSRPGPKGQALKGRAVTLASFSGSLDEQRRHVTGMAEFDRVTGGGLVPGSALLIGGDPGIGKSTLLTQISAEIARTGRPALYFTGEESEAQVRLRAQRLGLSDAPVALGAATHVGDIVETLQSHRDAALVVVDSIQTVYVDQLDSAPGTVAQVRASAHALIGAAKACNAALVLVGHVTKDGQIAGPRVLEHMVDAVLYFEGDRNHQFRILRTVKNRFGATDEIGVFSMTDKGLSEVENPSALFMGNRDPHVTGAAILASIEGTRPMLVEIEALVAPSALGTPRRTVVGWDQGRLAMVLAVLEARAGLSFSGHDVYLNIAGGLRVGEPAADLAAAAALVSARLNSPLPTDTAYFGEIALSGAVRPVGQAEQRLKEAQKLGLDHAVHAPGTPAIKGLRQTGIASALALVDAIRDG